MSDILSQLTRAHPQSTDGEMRHRAAADITRLTAENRQMLAVLQDTAQLQREILTGLKAAKATIAALTAEVVRLQGELKQCRKEKNELCLKAYPAMDERDSLTADNERLRAALEFYGNPENWESVWDHQFKMMVQEPVYRDKGDKARAALKQEPRT